MCNMLYSYTPHAVVSHAKSPSTGILPSIQARPSSAFLSAFLSSPPSPLVTHIHNRRTHLSESRSKPNQRLYKGDKRLCTIFNNQSISCVWLCVYLCVIVCVRFSLMPPIIPQHLQYSTHIQSHSHGYRMTIIIGKRVSEL